MTSATIPIRVVPRASKNQICGEIDGDIKIRLQAPPVEGKANKALIAFLAKKLGIPKRGIAVISGIKSRNKRIQIEGMTEKQVLDLLKK